MTPIMRKLREKKEKPADSGITIDVRHSDNEPIEDESVSAVEPFAAQILASIAANDHIALAEALVNAHDAMHAIWDNESTYNDVSPHTYDAQKDE